MNDDVVKRCSTLRRELPARVADHHRRAIAAAEWRTTRAAKLLDDGITDDPARADLYSAIQFRDENADEYAALVDLKCRNEADAAFLSAAAVRAVSAIVRLDELDDGVAGILGGGASQRIRGQA